MKSKDSNSKKSVSYQKKDGRGHVCPSLFWYDNDKDLKVCFLETRVICLGCRVMWSQIAAWESHCHSSLYVEGHLQRRFRKDIGKVWDSYKGPIQRYCKLSKMSNEIKGRQLKLSRNRASLHKGWLLEVGVKEWDERWWVLQISDHRLKQQ